MVNKNIINYDEMINLIRNQLIIVAEESYEYFKNYNIVVSKEQFYIKHSQVKPNSIYIAIKFSASSVNFAQTVLPVSLSVMTEQNSVEAAQKLLLDYVHKYNLESSSDMLQIYESPVVSSNFNKVFEGYRSILYVNGFFAISKNANYLTIKYPEITINENGEEQKEYKEVTNLTLNFNSNFMLDSQPFFNTNNFSESISKVGTITFSVVTYMVDDIKLVNDALDVSLGFVENDYPFECMLSFKNGKELVKDFKLVSFDYQGNIGQIPVVSMSFTM